MSDEPHKIDVKHAIALGRHAAREGKHECDCHYVDGDVLRVYWLQGYNAEKLRTQSSN